MFAQSQDLLLRQLK